jgi:hypothetical protein
MIINGDDALSVAGYALLPGLLEKLVTRGVLSAEDGRQVFEHAIGVLEEVENATGPDTNELATVATLLLKSLR